MMTWNHESGSGACSESSGVNERLLDWDRPAFSEAMRALFHPERLAIVGATPRRGFANNIHRGILRQGYEGEIFGVTPRHQEVLGAKCFPTIDAIPGGVEKAIIVVPSHLVLGILDQCVDAGVKAVNIITSGFGEQSDDEARDRQLRIKEYAARTGIRVVGPNCLGIVSTPAKMIAKSGPYETINPGHIGLVFQSGLLTYSTILPPLDRGFGYSYVVTTGNEADLESADFIRYFIQDDETQIIACFIEQFRNPDKLYRVAEMALEARKPLIVLKIGRSEGGQRAARAHTGSLVGSDAIADAVMRQMGIVRVDSLDEMIETLAAFHSKRLPKGPGVGAIFISGGAAGLVSDIAQDLGVSLPNLAPETEAMLKPIIPEYGTVGNPLDTTGQAATQPEITEASLVGMAEDPNIDTVIYGQAYPMTIDLDTPVGQVIKTMPGRYPDKTFFVMSLVTGQIRNVFRWGEAPSDPVADWDGVPFLQGTENSLRAVRSLIRHGSYRRAWENGEIPRRAPSDIAPHAQAIVDTSAGQPLSEREAKRLLALYDIPVTREALARTADDAVTIANDIGYPVVLKIESPDILHKTEAGGVALDIRSDSETRDAYQSILENAVRYRPDAKISGVVVQQMARTGRELILGMSRDHDFGAALAVGLGGIFVEVLKDVQIGVPPLTERDISEMLSRLRGYAILEGSGARGSRPADIDELVRIMTQFSQCCIDLDGVVSEIDINPLLLYDAGAGACVVDCLIVPASPRSA